MKAKRRALAQRREIVGHTQETLAEFMGVELRSRNEITCFLQVVCEPMTSTDAD